MRRERLADIELQMRGPGARVRARVLFEGKPVSHRSLLVDTALGSRKKFTFRLRPSVRHVVTDARGAFVVEGLAPRAPLRIAMALTPSECARLAERVEGPVAPWCVVVSTVVDGARELGEIEISKLCCVAISLRSADSFAAAAARLWLGEFGRPFRLRATENDARRRGPFASMRSDQPLEAAADHRGKLAAFVPRANALTIVARHRGALVWRALEFVDDLSSSLFTARFPETLTVRGSLRDSRGQRVPRAVLHVRPRRYPKSFDTRLAKLLTRVQPGSLDGSFSVDLPFPGESYVIFAARELHGGVQQRSGERVIPADEVEADHEIELEFGALRAPRDSLFDARFVPLKSVRSGRTP